MRRDGQELCLSFGVELLLSTSFCSSSSGNSVRGSTVPTFVGPDYMELK